eukprot:TRINITY_DN832_c0_g1_i3.p1 TRINITY_DN832_c0_g1~~TRINITY_DN832_c0_g1_i3.p1  ORF type:complete len:255 (-),score=41.42 TRINITY_DN832_c0_g1_i3:247-978(-)
MAALPKLRALRKLSSPILNSRKEFTRSSALSPEVALAKGPSIQASAIFSGNLLRDVLGHTNSVFLPLRHTRSFSSDFFQLPALEDADQAKAFRALIAGNWLHIDGGVRKQVENTLKNIGSGEAAALQAAWASAVAVEAFAEKLENLRSNLTGLSGPKFTGGDRVNALPSDLEKALVSAFRRYSTYLESFGADEEWLKKKVQEELGGSLLTIKQRVAGLEPSWNQISLLGTSGLGGSYLEQSRG